jgi:hypothetical protein
LSSSIHSTAAAPSEICDDVPALYHRVQRGEPFQGGVAKALVPGDHMAVRGRLLVLVEHRRLDATDLPVEAALDPGLLGLALRVEAELVDLLAADAAPLGDPLRGGELVGQVDVPRRRPQDAAIGARVGAEADTAHRLDAAGDPDVDGARGDQSGDQPVGLLAAAALAVDSHRANVLGQAGDQPADPRDVVGLLAELRDAAADDLLDVAGVDAGLLDERPLRGAQQLGGMQARQPSVPLANGTAGGFNDDRVTHSVRLEHVSLL